ncbi:DUF3088 domain-containing protein [Paraburkholderia terrae]
MQRHIDVPISSWRRASAAFDNTNDTFQQVPRAMSRDLLLLLEPGFTDPRYPGERFICPDGAPIEGLLASDPARVAGLDVRRVPFERPRQAVVEVLDEAHQGLPVLVLGDEQPAPADAQTLGERRFITDTRRILDLLAERHGFPKVH